MATTVCTTTRVTVPARPTTPPPQLSINTSTTHRSTPPASSTVPNKHLPTFPAIAQPVDNSPASPPRPSQTLETTSLTYPPSDYPRITTDPPVYSITGAQLAQALHHLETQPLPPAKQVFPWFHGLHPDNQLQLAFFTGRKKSLRRTPRCIRGLTIVKSGGDLLEAKLKGATAPQEILKPCEVLEDHDACAEEHSEFLDVDPRDGFGVRNFQIQAGKMATVSDVVVYADAHSSSLQVETLAKRISRAQAAWQRRADGGGCQNRLFNTFVLSDDFATMEAEQPELVAVDSTGRATGKVIDFFHSERVEMTEMSAPTQITRNVWLGPSPDLNLALIPEGDRLIDNRHYDIHIHASDMADIPDARAFEHMERFLEQRENGTIRGHDVPMLEFPGSGAILPPTWSHAEVDGLMMTLEWMHKQTTFKKPPQRRRDSKLSLTPERDAEGDTRMRDTDDDENDTEEGRRILIHCPDGYTESSLLALAYLMYTECMPAHQAWLHLHRERGRNFFAYASDLALLKAIQPRILQASPSRATLPTQQPVRDLDPPAPEWLERMDGSLPSRILPYMYLGNLNHANNPELLRELKIGRILSVGERVNWSPATLKQWGKENLMFVDQVQDNGVDPLTEEFERCLEFIANGREQGQHTLVHCRVGVSRSATICIAEVMDRFGLSFPRAYCYVRARRLNVIIQPHLRFSYELLKWEETQCEKRGKPLRRELEWATIAREIAAMNKPYSRQN